MSETKLPKDWDSEKVHRVLAHYESQTDDDAALEDEAGFSSITHTSMEVPVELVPEVRELIAKRREG